MEHSETNPRHLMIAVIGTKSVICEGKTAQSGVLFGLSLQLIQALC